MRGGVPIASKYLGIHRVGLSCPTPQLAAFHVAVEACAYFQLEASVGGATTAFMQGDPSNRKEPLYAMLSCDDFEPLGVAKASPARLDRELDGLVSGVRALCSTRVDRLTRVLGYKLSALCRCLFFLFGPSLPTVAGLLVREVKETFPPVPPTTAPRCRSCSR